MIEGVLILFSILLGVTITGILEYYRKLREIQKEYDKAKRVVEDIIVSFNRELRREAEKLNSFSSKVELSSSNYSLAINKTEELGKEWHSLEPKIGAISESHEKILTRIDEMDKRVCDTAR